jgi:hypothetical protein
VIHETCGIARCGLHGSVLQTPRVNSRSTESRRRLPLLGVSSGVPRSHCRDPFCLVAAIRCDSMVTVRGDGPSPLSRSVAPPSPGGSRARRILLRACARNGVAAGLSRRLWLGGLARRVTLQSGRRFTVLFACQFRWPATGRDRSVLDAVSYSRSLAMRDASDLEEQ